MPVRKTYWYSVKERCGSDLRYELAGVSRLLRDVAVDAAEDFHGNHDGWEFVWPLEITLYESEEGPPIARFDVEREVVPQFHAWERELPPSVAAVDPQVDSTGTPSTRD